MSELMPKSAPATAGLDPLAPLRYLDVILVVLAAPFVLLLGGPVLGYTVGAVVWLAQRGLEVWLDRVGERGDARRAVGLKFASMIARTWAIGIAILVVGLSAERVDGFTAALLCLAAFTVHLATMVVVRSLEGSSTR